MFRLLLFVFLITFVLCKNALRERRFIRGTYTNTVTETRLVTSWVPSSCVYVEPTLQPCRNVRYMRFPNFVADGWQSITEDQSLKKEEPQQETGLDVPLSWAEYFGLYAPTVTATHTEFQTVTAKDPRIVVTFAVKGCKPLKIPNDLDRCPDENSASVPIQGIVPTSTVQTLHTSATIDPHELTTQKNARFIDLSAAKMYEELRQNYGGGLPSFEQGLDGTQGNVEDSEAHKPTEALS